MERLHSSTNSRRVVAPQIERRLYSSEDGPEGRPRWLGGYLPWKGSTDVVTNTFKQEHRSHVCCHIHPVLIIGRRITPAISEHVVRLLCDRHFFSEPRLALTLQRRGFTIMIIIDLVVSDESSAQSDRHFWTSIECTYRQLVASPPAGESRGFTVIIHVIIIIITSFFQTFPAQGFLTYQQPPWRCADIRSLRATSWEHENNVFAFGYVHHDVVVQWTPLVVWSLRIEQDFPGPTKVHQQRGFVPFVGDCDSETHMGSALGWTRSFHLFAREDHHGSVLDPVVPLELPTISWESPALAWGGSYHTCWRQTPVHCWIVLFSCRFLNVYLRCTDAINQTSTTITICVWWLKVRKSTCSQSAWLVDEHDCLEQRCDFCVLNLSMNEVYKAWIAGMITLKPLWELMLYPWSDITPSLHTRNPGDCL